MKSIITATELQSILTNEQVVIIDATSGTNAKQIYLEKHLVGALFVDLEKDLSAIADPKIGGRHPLPFPAVFSEILANLGITGSSHIVVYDRANGINAAARFWWMARSAGLQHVQVLDGGFVAAENLNLSMKNGDETAAVKSSFRFETWQLPTVSMDEVRNLSQDQNSLIIDVREEFRYQGTSEPIDLVAGHIPSAVNIPLSNNLADNGTFKTPEMLRSEYASAFQGKENRKIVVHCGSGVSACHTLLALDIAGFDIPQLYVGSWSEWSRNDLPREPKTS